MDITIKTYIILIKKGKITLEDVPIEYREQVQKGVA